MTARAYKCTIRLKGVAPPRACGVRTSTARCAYTAYHESHILATKDGSVARQDFHNAYAGAIGVATQLHGYLLPVLLATISPDWRSDHGRHATARPVPTLNMATR